MHLSFAAASFSLALLCAGCAGTGSSINDALTPGAKVLHDKFDNSTIVRQEPVNAGAGISDAWHTLGFEWISSNPKTIYLIAGTQGRTRVNGLAFNADGKMLTDIKLASEHTEIDHGGSTRRFSMPLADFLVITRAKAVQMRLSQGNNYTVSSFGPAYPNATVNTKLKPFTDKVLQHGAGL